MTSQNSLRVMVPAVYWRLRRSMRSSSFLHLQRRTHVWMPARAWRTVRQTWRSSSFKRRRKCHSDGRRTLTSIGRDLYGRPKNRPITDKVIVRNPGCTLLSDTVLFFFGMATHFWPLTVCLSRLVYRVCRMLMHASTLNYRCVFRWHMKQPLNGHMWRCLLWYYTVSQKTLHQTLSLNFTNYYPISIFFSLADSVVNLQHIHV